VINYMLKYIDLLYDLKSGNPKRFRHL